MSVKHEDKTITVYTLHCDKCGKPIRETLEPFSDDFRIICDPCWWNALRGGVEK